MYDFCACSVCVYVCVWCVLVFVWLFFVCVSSSCMIFLVLCFGACTNCSRIRFLSLACHLFLSLNSIGNEPNNRATQQHVRVPLLGVSNLVSPCILFQFREWVGKQNTVFLLLCGLRLLVAHSCVFVLYHRVCSVFSCSYCAFSFCQLRFVCQVAFRFCRVCLLCSLVSFSLVFFRGLQILATKKTKKKRGGKPGI